MAYNDPPTYVTKGLLPHYGDYPLYGATSIDNVSVGGSATRIETTSLMDTTKKFVQGMRELGEINISGNAPLQSDFVQWLYGEQENGIFHTFTLVIGTRSGAGAEGATDGTGYTKDTSMQNGVDGVSFTNGTATTAPKVTLTAAKANKINGIIPGDYLQFAEASSGNTDPTARKITAVKSTKTGGVVTSVDIELGVGANQAVLGALAGSEIPASDSAITIYSPAVKIESSASVQSFNYSTPQDGVVQYTLMLNVTGEGTHTNGNPNVDISTLSNIY